MNPWSDMNLEINAGKFNTLAEHGFFMLKIGELIAVRAL